jgi:hypothetical protein
VELHKSAETRSAEFWRIVTYLFQKHTTRDEERTGIRQSVAAKSCFQTKRFSFSAITSLEILRHICCQQINPLTRLSR